MSPQPIKIILLNHADNKIGRKIIQKFSEVTGDKVKLMYFLEPIPQDIFDLEMNRSHFLLLPLNSDTSHGLVYQKGGIHTMSASIGDMVRYGKRALITEDYSLPNFLEKYVVRFNESNLFDKIINCLSADINIQAPYLPNEITNEFKKTIEELINY